MRGGKLYWHDDCGVLCTGPGKNIASTMEQFRIDLCRTNLVVVGYAGSLNPNLRQGDIVVCKTFFHPGLPSIPSSDCASYVATSLESLGIRVHIGGSYTANQVITDPEAKCRMATEQPDAIVVEMENYWAACQAEQWKTHLLSVRIVLDSLHEQLPDMMDMITSKGEISKVNVCHHLLWLPGHIGHMIKLCRSSKELLARLDCCCNLIKSLRNHS